MSILHYSISIQAYSGERRVCSIHFTNGEPKTLISLFQGRTENTGPQFHHSCFSALLTEPHWQLNSLQFCMYSILKIYYRQNHQCSHWDPRLYSELAQIIYISNNSSNTEMQPLLHCCTPFKHTTKMFWSEVTRVDIWRADKARHGIVLLLLGGGRARERRVQKKTGLLSDSTALVGCNVA